MIGLYSGRDIVARKASGKMLTRTQTAASAYNAITKKYGDISASAKYFHKGKGNWVRYSITNDRKRTGKTTNDIKKWRAAPHKLDYKGKDTADTGSCGKSLSTAALTTSREMVRRSGSRKIPTNKYHDVHGKLKFGKFVGRYRDIAYTYHPKQNTLSFKWDTGGKRMAIPPQFKTLRDVEVNNRLMTKHEVVEFAKKSIDIVIRGVDNVFYKTHRNLSNDEVARATKTGKHKGKSADKKDAKRVSTAAQLHNPFNLPIRRISLNIPESSRKSARGRDKLYHSIHAHGIIDEIDNKAFLDRLTSKQLQYIIENYTQYQKPFPENPRFVYTVSEPRFKASQMVTPKAQLKKRDSKKPIVCKRSAITKHMPKPIKTEKGKAAGKSGAKRVDRDKLSVAERAPDVKASTGTKPATFDLKNNPNRKEFVSDYTGITDHLQRRAKRLAKIRADQDKGRYKNADTRRREASHAKYVKRAEKIRTSYPKKR